MKAAALMVVTVCLWCPGTAAGGVSWAVQGCLPGQCCLTVWGRSREYSVACKGPGLVRPADRSRVLPGPTLPAIYSHHLTEPWEADRALAGARSVPGWVWTAVTLSCGLRDEACAFAGLQVLSSASVWPAACLEGWLA